MLIKGNVAPSTNYQNSMSAIVPWKRKTHETLITER